MAQRPAAYHIQQQQQQQQQQRYNPQQQAYSPYPSAANVAARGKPPYGQNSPTPNANSWYNSPRPQYPVHGQPTLSPQVRLEKQFGPLYLDELPTNRLMLSLRSNIPDEMDFALSRLLHYTHHDPHLIRLEKFPGLIDALLECIEPCLNHFSSSSSTTTTTQQQEQEHNQGQDQDQDQSMILLSTTSDNNKSKNNTFFDSFYSIPRKQGCSRAANAALVLRNIAAGEFHSNLECLISYSRVKDVTFKVFETVAKDISSRYAEDLIETCRFLLEIMEIISSSPKFLLWHQSLGFDIESSSSNSDENENNETNNENGDDNNSNSNSNNRNTPSIAATPATTSKATSPQPLAKIITSSRHLVEPLFTFAQLSQDRAFIISAFRILANAASITDNERVFTCPASLLVLERALELLPLQDPDIHLAILDFIYAYSFVPGNDFALCARPDISHILRSLVSSLESDAIVEEVQIPPDYPFPHKSSSSSSQQQQQQQVNGSSTSATTDPNAPSVPDEIDQTSSPAPKPRRNLTIDDCKLTDTELKSFISIPEPRRTLLWMQHVFEFHPGSEITQVSLWTAYRKEFEPHDRKPHAMLAAAEVIKHTTEAFTHALPMVTGGDDRRFIIKNMRIRERLDAFETYECHWHGCKAGSGASTADELFNHLRETHIWKQKPTKVQSQPPQNQSEAQPQPQPHTQTQTQPQPQAQAQAQEQQEPQTQNPSQEGQQDTQSTLTGTNTEQQQQQQQQDIQSSNEKQHQALPQEQQQNQDNVQDTAAQNDIKHEQQTQNGLENVQQDGKQDQENIPIPSAPITTTTTETTTTEPIPTTSETVPPTLLDNTNTSNLSAPLPSQTPVMENGAREATSLDNSAPQQQQQPEVPQQQPEEKEMDVVKPEEQEEEEEEDLTKLPHCKWSSCSYVCPPGPDSNSLDQDGKPNKKELRRRELNMLLHLSTHIPASTKSLKEKAEKEKQRQKQIIESSSTLPKVPRIVTQSNRTMASGPYGVKAATSPTGPAYLAALALRVLASCIRNHLRPLKQLKEQQQLEHDQHHPSKRHKPNGHNHVNGTSSASSTTARHLNSSTNSYHVPDDDDDDEHEEEEFKVGWDVLLSGRLHEVEQARQNRIAKEAKLERARQAFTSVEEDIIRNAAFNSALAPYLMEAAEMIADLRRRQNILNKLSINSKNNDNDSNDSMQVDS